MCHFLKSVNNLLISRVKSKNLFHRWNKRQIHTIRAHLSLSGLQQEKCTFNDCLLTSDEEKSEFESVYPQLMDDIVNESREACSSTLSQHIEEMLRYNVGSGTNFRGLAAMKAYKMIEKPEKLTPEKVKLACIMGWLIELSGGAVTMSDDMVDGSHFRRGHPAWYTKKDVGLNCVNDALLLNTAHYLILTKYFEHLPCYGSFLRVFNRVNIKGYLGLIMDGLPSRRSDWDLFTVEQCLQKIRIVAGYTAFTWGTELAMRLADISNPDLIAKSNNLTIDMGMYYQLLNDYSDCFIDGMELSGKSLKDDDIRCRKLTWHATTALTLCTPSQRKIFVENYGRDETVEIVKKLYADFNMKQRYEEFLNDMLSKIMDNIEKLPAELPRQFYMHLINQVVHVDPL